MTTSDSIEVEVSINETVTVDVSVHRILSAIHELPLTGKWNVIAKMLNNVDVDDKDLSEQQRKVIIGWLEKKIQLFKTKEDKDL